MPDFETATRQRRTASGLGRMTLALAVPALGLAGCQFRDDNEDPPAVEPTASPTETGDPAAEPSPETTESPVSIIRDDASPGPIVEVPPEPVERAVPFAQGGTDLSERAERILAGILEAEAMDEDWPIILRGHTDSEGNDQANLRASRARAEAVAAWLVERGVADDRIEVIAMGEQNPVAPNALPNGEPNEDGRARNRRVDVEIAPPDEDEVTVAGSEEEDGEGPSASPSPTSTGQAGGD